ncbi:MAG: response regulator [Candidatus Thermoplasmatota archaeon]|nr:response regulator [Candidatus Thermoplasmatota archaeon]
MDDENGRDSMERILVIDDDVCVLNLLHFVLVCEGYEVLKASGGKEGMKLHRENPVDLIITDLIMPEKDGIEIIRELTSESPNIKIIAISGGGQIGPEDYLHMAKVFGAKRTLAKPIGRDELVRTVKEVLC